MRDISLNRKSGIECAQKMMLMVVVLLLMVTCQNDADGRDAAADGDDTENRHCP